MDSLIQRILYPPKVSNEDAFDTVKQYWDDVLNEYWYDTDEQLADELGVTPTALAELLEVNRHTFEYANIGGNSSVRGYDHGEDWLVVMFSDGSRYLYTLKSTDREALDYMRQLAMQGKGLNSYITRIIGPNYAGRNYKGTITIKPGMEKFNPQGYKRIQLIEAFRNTMANKSKHNTLIKYRNQIEAAGSDGLDPLARQVMSVGLESMGIGNRVALESFQPTDDAPTETTALETVIDEALSGSAESFWGGIKDFFAGRPKNVHLSGRDTNLMQKLNSTINDRVWLSRQKYTLGEVSYKAIPGLTTGTAAGMVLQYVSQTNAAAQFNQREMSKIRDRLGSVQNLMRMFATRPMYDLGLIERVAQDLHPYTVRLNIRIREPEISFGIPEPQTGPALTKIEVKQFAELVGKVFATQHAFEKSYTFQASNPYQGQLNFHYGTDPKGQTVLTALNRLQAQYVELVRLLNREIRQQISTHAAWIAAENLADSLVNYISKSITNVSSNEAYVGKSQASNESIWGAVRYLFGGNYEDLPKINAAYDEALHAVKSTYGNPQWVEKRRLKTGHAVKVKGYSGVMKDPAVVLAKVKQNNQKSIEHNTKVLKDELEYIGKFVKALTGPDRNNSDKIQSLVDMFSDKAEAKFIEAEEMDFGSPGDVKALDKPGMLKCAETFEGAIKYRIETDLLASSGFKKMMYTDGGKERWGDEGTETAKLEGPAKELAIGIGERFNDIQEDYYSNNGVAWLNADSVVKGCLMWMEASAD